MDESWRHTKSVLLDLATNLRCLICEKLPVNPHILWCKHSYCKECILPKLNNCPQCNFYIVPQQVVPDIMLSQLLSAIKIAADISKCENIQNLENVNQSKSLKRSNVLQRCSKKIKTQPHKEANTDEIQIKSTKRNTRACTSLIKHTPDSNKPLIKMPVSKTKSRKRSDVISNLLTKTDKDTNEVPVSKGSPKPNILYYAKQNQSANKINKKGETPLQIVCRQGKLDSVRQLLKGGAEPNVKDFANWTPLCDAVGAGNVEVVKVLLEAGAGVNTPAYLNTTALLEAVVKKNKAMIKLLMSYGANMHQRTSLNNTPWSIADDELRAVMMEFENVATMPHPRIKVRPTYILIHSLPQEHIDHVIKLCKKFNLTLATAFMKDISHIIVEKTEFNTCDGSVMIMLGILNGCSVVGIDWVTACLQEDELLPVDNFEPDGTNDHRFTNVFQRARLNREQLLPKLFDGCHIALQHNQTWEPQLKRDLVTLVEASGAQYVPRECDPDRISTDDHTVMFHTLPDSPLGHTSHIILYQPESCDRLIVYNMRHAKSFLVSWFIQCIQTFKIS